MRKNYSNKRYYQNSGGNNRGFSRGNGNGRFNKFFNPQNMVTTSQDVAPQEEYTAKYRFSDFPLDAALQNNIQKKNYGAPTPVQDQAIIPILEGRDVIGIANTGTGKTAAFLIPLINAVIKNRHKKILIVAPTRELAVQIEDEFIDFSRGLGLYSVLCIGGTNLNRQRNALRRTHHFVIGTPGRLKDLVKTRDLELFAFACVVLDEADHMVDIGFIHDIKFLIGQLPATRQSLFFSATIDGKVKEVLQAFVKNPVTVSVAKRATAENITQKVVKVIDRHKKVDQLHDLLIQAEFTRVLIFGKTKWGVQKLSDELIHRGFKAGVIHGNKNQNQRLRTLEQFKRNDISILLATDVASRGLDIRDVSHVINYDMPATEDDYIHRIGRTGRADKKGTAYTFVD